MNDEIIISLLTNSKGKTIGARLLEPWLKEHPEVKDYLINRYTDTDDNTSFSEIFFRIKNHIEIKPVCKVCGKPVKFQKGGGLGYSVYCSGSCAAKDPDLIERKKKKCLEKYGTEWYSQTQDYRDKCKSTCQERYGVSSYTKLNECKEKIANTNLEKYGSSCSLHGKDIEEKVKRTNLEKYGVENVFAAEEIKEKLINTNLEKYGYENPMQNNNIKSKAIRTMIDRYGVVIMTQIPEISKVVQEKRYITQQLNNSFNISNLEEKCYFLLKTIFKDIVRQYKSEIYPYRCDFYVPSLNLFIEFQGNWTHGKHPYNPISEEDNAIIKKWKDKNTKYYNSAIRTWTITDPLKRKIAKDNNLNYIEFWNIREVEAYVNSFTK